MNDSDFENLINRTLNTSYQTSTVVNGPPPVLNIEVLLKAMLKISAMGDGLAKWMTGQGYPHRIRR